MISYRFSAVHRLGLGMLPRDAKVNVLPPPRCVWIREAPLKNAPLLESIHNALIETDIHLSLSSALDRSNSKTVLSCSESGGTGQAKILARRKPGCGSTCLAGFETETDN